MSNVLSHENRLRVLTALLDGNSVRATSRMTRVVDGGKAKSVVPMPIAPTPAPIAVAVPIMDETGQLDLLSWRPKNP